MVGDQGDGDQGDRDQRDMGDRDEVAISRLVIGVHRPPDVVAGCAIGLGTTVAIGQCAVLVTGDHPFATAAARPDRSRG